MWKIICLWDIAIVYICVWHIGGSETRSEFSMVTRKTIKLQREFFFFLLLTWLHQNTGEGRKSCTILWQRRREEGAHGLFVCIPHPLDTQSGLYCVLQIYTQDVGLECFPGKKKREGLFFKCLLSWPRVIEAHKQTFVLKLTDAKHERGRFVFHPSSHLHFFSGMLWNQKRWNQKIKSVRHLHWNLDDD